MAQSWRGLFRYLAGPVITGLIVAALLLIFFPGYREQGKPIPRNEAQYKSVDLQSGGSQLSGPASYSDAVRRAAPSVVNIYTRSVARTASHPLLNDPLFSRLFNFQQQRIQNSLGSGVIMRSDGYILTNQHVVEGADEILVLLYDGREVPAVTVGTDSETDLAVLKIEADKLRPVSVADPAQARVGDVVLAIGNPFGVGQTVTQGIISATGRNGLGLNTFENFIQTDADINPGNSGGALVDSFGNLLGINTAILSQTGSVGISFAIPSDTAAKVLNDIVSHGRVVRGWLGVDAIPLNAQLAARFNLVIDKGLLVRAIYAGSPAHVAGIQPGDVVTAINGEKATDRQTSLSQIANVNPGETIRLEIWRRGETFMITAVAGTRPPQS